MTEAPADAATDLGPASSTVLSGLFARYLVQTNLFDRVSIIPDRLDYALVPLSVFNRLVVSSTSPGNASASTSLPAINDKHEEPETLYLTVDDQLVYARFFADFGPLDLAQTVRFCRDITQHLAESKRVMLISSDHPHKRANVMALLALYCVMVQKQTPLRAIAPFQSLRPAQGFRDAACGLCLFFLTVYDCARAVHKAMRESIFCYESFPLDEYEHYDKLHNGDINWIVPGKILAFSGPQRERVVLDESGHTTLLAHDYAKVFQTLGVSCVVRFNEPTTYDRRAFIQANIRHIDVHYPDGGNPTDEIMFKFVRTCERESGAVAVHCKAGLGRTGTNIAAYLMKKHRFSAVEAIAWCRICRPGSIVGPQQHFLVVKQPQLWQAGAREDEEQQQQSRKADSLEDRAKMVKKQPFAAMRDRLPPATAVEPVPLRRPLHRGLSGPAASTLVTAKRATRPLR